MCVSFCACMVFIDKIRPCAPGFNIHMSLRVANLAFLTPNLTNLAFFRGLWRQKNCLAFWLFFFQIWLFLRQWTAEIFVYLGVLLTKNLAFLEENRVQEVAW